jgi:hypothetical protein
MIAKKSWHPLLVLAAGLFPVAGSGCDEKPIPKLTVTFLDKDTGKAVAGLNVELTGPGAGGIPIDDTQTTDSNGVVTFKDPMLTNKLYTLDTTNASSLGYVDVDQEVSFADPGAATLTISMTKAVQIVPSYTIAFLDANGAPVIAELFVEVKDANGVVIAQGTSGVMPFGTNRTSAITFTNAIPTNTPLTVLTLTASQFGYQDASQNFTVTDPTMNTLVVTLQPLPAKTLP